MGPGVARLLVQVHEGLSYPVKSDQSVLSRLFNKVGVIAGDLVTVDSAIHYHMTNMYSLLTELASKALCHRSKSRFGGSKWSKTRLAPHRRTSSSKQ